jgi:hypothetical protein
MDDDPDKPSPRTLGLWKYYCMCRDCSTADMQRPDQQKVHPPTGIKNRLEVRPGTHLVIDGSCSFETAAMGGETQAFIFAYVASGYKSARPTRDKCCYTLVEEVKLWISHVSYKPEEVSLKSIHTDNEFLKAPLRQYCKDHHIKLTACAPHTHQQNPIAETTVKMIKRTVRRNEVTAGTGSKLWARCYTYSGQQLCRHHTMDANGHWETPVSRWPNTPYYHAQQTLHPWGCLVHGFVGKRSTAQNSAPRAYP